MSEQAESRRKHRLRDLFPTLTGQEAVDPARIADSVREFARGRRYLLPILYVGTTIDAVVAGVLLLLSNWRLLLVEIVPALWLGAITWDWRARTFGALPLAEVHGLVAVGVAILVLALTVLAYWCNSIFAYTAVQQAPIDLHAAYRATNRHWRLILSWALLIGAAHAFVAVVVTRTTVLLYTISLGAIVLVQMYALVALPVALVTGATRVKENGRASRALVSAGLSGLASTPGFILNRIGILFFALGLPWLGVLLLIPAVVIQAAGAASARAVLLAARVQEASDSAAVPTA